MLPPDPDNPFSRSSPWGRLPSQGRMRIGPLPKSTEASAQPPEPTPAPVPPRPAPKSFSTAPTRPSGILSGGSLTPQGAAPRPLATLPMPGTRAPTPLATRPLAGAPAPRPATPTPA
ncbi:MAG: hypothetical protein Q7T84_07105, partial [Phenylobacterium sp.]|nr:hypothetical protein [Phenylobacterium sp.]